MIDKIKRPLGLLLVLPLLLLSGCWDSKELDTIFIVTAIGMDLADAENDVDLSVQIGTVQSGSPGSKSADEKPYLVMKSKNRSVYGSIDYLRANSTRHLFLEHNQIRLFGQALAEAGIEPYLDFFVRDLQTRMEVWMLIAENSTDEILEMEMDVEGATGTALSRMLINRADISEVLATRLLDFVSKLLDGTTSATIPIVERARIDGEEKLRFKNLAVFKGDRMVGMFDDQETWGLVLASGDVHAGAIYIHTPDGEGELKIDRSSSKITPILYSDGSVRAEVKIDCELVVGELIGFADEDFTTFEYMLAGAASVEIRKLVLQCIDAAAELNADVFGIGKTLAKQYPDHWPEIRDRWGALYPKIDWRIEINARVVDDGRVSMPLTMREGNGHDIAGS